MALPIEREIVITLAPESTNRKREKKREKEKMALHGELSHAHQSTKAGGCVKTGETRIDNAINIANTKTRGSVEIANTNVGGSGFPGNVIEGAVSIANTYIDRGVADTIETGATIIKGPVVIA